MTDNRIDIVVPEEALAGNAAAVRRLDVAHRRESATAANYMIHLMTRLICAEKWFRAWCALARAG